MFYSIVFIGIEGEEEINVFLFGINIMDFGYLYLKLWNIYLRYKK